MDVARKPGCVGFSVPLQAVPVPSFYRALLQHIQLHIQVYKAHFANSRWKYIDSVRSLWVHQVTSGSMLDLEEEEGWASPWLVAILWGFCRGCNADLISNQQHSSWSKHCNFSQIFVLSVVAHCTGVSDSTAKGPTANTWVRRQELREAPCFAPAFGTTLNLSQIPLSWQLDSFPSLSPFPLFISAGSRTVVYILH